MPFTLAQLRYFCELAEVGSFGRAAERLHMSQPPLSRQIATMEAVLGVELFERGPKGVTLTPAGRQLLIDAREVLRLAALAQHNVKAARSGEVGQLSLGFTMCTAFSVVPTLTRLYKSAFPNVDFRVREMTPFAQQRALREGDIDVGISLPGIEGPRITARPLLTEPMDVVLPVDHRLARARRLRVRDLRDDSFIVVPQDQGPILHDNIIRRCQADGFTPIIGLQVYLQQTIVNLVAEGLGVAFVPTSMRKARLNGVVFKAVEAPPMIEQLVVWESHSANPCIKGFLDVCATLRATV